MALQQVTGDTGPYKKETLITVILIAPGCTQNTGEAVQPPTLRRHTRAPAGLRFTPSGDLLPVKALDQGVRRSQLWEQPPPPVQSPPAAAGTRAGTHALATLRESPTNSCPPQTGGNPSPCISIGIDIHTHAERHRSALFQPATNCAGNVALKQKNKSCGEKTESC